MEDGVSASMDIGFEELFTFIPVSILTRSRDNILEKSHTDTFTREPSGLRLQQVAEPPPLKRRLPQKSQRKMRPKLQEQRQLLVQLRFPWLTCTLGYWGTKKAIPELDKIPYTYSTVMDGGKKIYTITAKGNNPEPIDNFEVDPAKNIFTVLNAQNNNDNTPGKLSLSELMMSVWKKEGKLPKNLEMVRYDDVTNSAAKAGIKYAYKDHKLDIPFGVKASDQAGKKEVFKDLASVNTKGTLMGNELTGSLQKILREYDMDGKKVTEVSVSYNEYGQVIMEAKLGK
ncbi:unnamed protein product [Clonostachys byssicola]|uniref:Uncharacterized protein n=1 Tax=Clonostachys byssicola TaxID=160290 RepID=A0A9N9XYL7_9HYPO|nr:unnamed protein product [Clonostachys byssicola]